MRRLLFTLVLAAAASASAAEVATLSPAQAAKLVAAGSAVLIDVREPAEWKETGVVAGAALLPKSDFDGRQKLWKEFLARHGGQELILYCRSGRRAGQVGASLAAQGHQVANAGGFDDWREAGQPIRPVEKVR
jgi:rhodanese-related sulfurtransferase